MPNQHQYPILSEIHQTEQGKQFNELSITLLLKQKGNVNDMM